MRWVKSRLISGDIWIEKVIDDSPAGRSWRSRRRYLVRRQKEWRIPKRTWPALETVQKVWRYLEEKIYDEDAIFYGVYFAKDITQSKEQPPVIALRTDYFNKRMSDGLVIPACREFSTRKVRVIPRYERDHQVLQVKCVLPSYAREDLALRDFQGVRF